MIAPAEDEFLPTLLGSIEGAAREPGDGLDEWLRDFDLEGFGELRRLLEGVGVGVGVLDARPRTMTVPLIPAWIEQ